MRSWNISPNLLCMRQRDGFRYVFPVVILFSIEMCCVWGAFVHTLSGTVTGVCLDWSQHNFSAPYATVWDTPIVDGDGRVSLKITVYAIATKCEDELIFINTEKIWCAVKSLINIEINGDADAMVPTVDMILIIGMLDINYNKFFTPCSFS